MRALRVGSTRPSMTIHRGTALAREQPRVAAMREDIPEDMTVVRSAWSTRVEKPGSTTLLAAVDRRGHRSTSGDGVRELDLFCKGARRCVAVGADGPVDITRLAP